jgi:site-specific DNA-methyltransferase (adenine-specific)
MEPSLPLNQVIHGDCIDILSSFPEKSIDVIFADPPYNLQLHHDLYRPNQTKVDAVDDAWDKFSGFSEYDRFTHNWIAACRRVLKDTGTIWVIGSYHNIFRVGSILQDLDFWILNDVIWIKTNPMPNFRGVRFSNAHETLIWAQKIRGARYTFNHHTMKALNEELQMRSDWTIPLTGSKERIRVNGAKAHSTQKPSGLLYRVILSSTNCNDVILDPFFGSGTTGAIAKLLHRNWIGIEKEKKYINLSQKRIDEIKPAPLESITLDISHRERRIPFGALVETGLLKPGQTLWCKQDGVTATVLSNGKIKYGNRIDSIHGLAKSLTNSPANGWDFWFYKDDAGKRKPINDLRNQIRDDLPLT